MAKRIEVCWLRIWDPQLQPDIRTRIEERIQSIYRKWSGTPYRPFHRKVGIGADCREFVVAVMDELHGRTKPTELPIGPQTLVWHKPKIAARFAHLMRKNYTSKRVRPDENGIISVQPADIIVCKIGQGPGHVAMVGCNNGEVWHASEKDRRVVCTGASCLPEIMMVYRATEIERWDPQWAAGK